MISDITNPFFADMVRGIEDCVHTCGKTFNILLRNTEENDGRERRALDTVLEKRIDGIIIVPTGGNGGLLDQARDTDAAEDQAHGADRRGDETPDWMADKQRRLETVRAAKALLGGSCRSTRSGRRERAGRWLLGRCGSTAAH